MEEIDSQLNSFARSLDISPTDFVRARDRYTAVKSWLLEGNYSSGTSPRVYLQGSFRLGTVVRPFHGDRDADFDIDQVCEITRPNVTILPSNLKNDVGDRLKANRNYSRMLDEEGRRCWTVIYASEDDRPGFHIDVLPSVTSTPGTGTQIRITDKDKHRRTYDWSASNPNGYYLWFKSKNEFTDELVRRQREQIFEANPGIFDRSDDVPKRLIRSSLQRAIQLMKRHRDVYFSNKEYRPISIILTTIAAHLYSGKGASETIKEFVEYATRRQEELLRNGSLAVDGILDYFDGEWRIFNPVHQGREFRDRENFADKWNEDRSYPAAFFRWVRTLKRTLNRFEQSQLPDDLNLMLPYRGDGTPFHNLLQDRMESQEERGRIHDLDLLDLIHLGIEGKVAWESVKEKALRYYRLSKDDYMEDVYKINYYQVVRHRNIDLSPQARADIESIIRDHSEDSAYVLCGNILLGYATKEMLRQCVISRSSDDVFSWPIMNLADDSLLVP